MLHLLLDDLAPPTPHLPQRSRVPLAQLGVSGALHVALAVVVSLITIAPPTRIETNREDTLRDQQRAEVRHIVFLTPELTHPGGGGGGGNRQAGPIRRAEAVGTAARTVRVRKLPQQALVGRGFSPSFAKVVKQETLPPVVDEVPELPSLVLDATPLASGTFDQIGLPTLAPSLGTSTGSGSGGGVGTGTGTGIGSGRGPGLGPGSGGGTGGGPYRAGGSVTIPRVITRVKPAYTNDALTRRIEGSVTLEAVVLADGTPSQIRVVKSLDRVGLDEQAILAVTKWRFEPGRLDGTPVDVLVRIILDFSIR